MTDPQKYLVGASGWNYPDWEGRFYPAGFPKNRWLEYYAKKFRTLDLNIPFYRFFKEEKWKTQIPDGFKFVVSVPHTITHQKYLRNIGSDIAEFREALAAVGHRIGLVLLQIAAEQRFAPDVLESTLQSFAMPGKIAVEFENPIWFTRETYNVLKRANAATCILDSAQTELMDWVTSDKSYLRLAGRTNWHSYDYSAHELREITDFVKKLNRAGAKQIYIFFSNDFDAFAVRNALTLMEMLRE